MPEVRGPNGEVVNIPNNINGRNIRKTFNLPPNKVITKVNPNGEETLIKDNDQVTIQPGDSIESTTSFERG